MQTFNQLPDQQDQKSGSGPEQGDVTNNKQAVRLRNRIWLRLLVLVSIGLVLFGITVSILVSLRKERAGAGTAEKDGAFNSVAISQVSKPPSTLQPGDASGEALAPSGSPILPEEIAWFYEGVDLSPKTGIFSSLVMGEDGAQYAAYLDDQFDTLKVASRKGGSWKYGSILEAAAGRNGWFPSLAFDRSGTLHLSYYSIENRQLVYAKMPEEGKWDFEVAVDNLSALDTSLAIDDDFAPHIAFFNEESGTVQYAVRNNGRWMLSTIGEGDKEGVYYPIAVDHQKNVHIAYKSISGALLYAKLDNASWHTTVIDITGSFPALALDDTGNPRISYFDSVNQNLKYAYFDGEKWHSAVVDSQGDVGKYTSIAVDGNGNVHISYYDEGNTALKYAFLRENSWHIEVVNDDGDVGKHNDLVLDQDNNPRISYYDESLRVLLVAYANVYQPTVENRQRLAARHHSGQTFLTWPERSDLSNEIYRIYRSNEPIDNNNLRQAAFLAQVGEESSRFWANYHTSDGIWKPRLMNYLIIEDGAAPLGKGTGSFVWTSAPEDFGGNPGGTVYYAVTITDNGSNTEQLFEGFSTGPVQETVEDPLPVEITTSPGIRVPAQAGGHYYLQFMDFRKWNPTFHAPNATNLYYGFDPSDPSLKDAVAYAYDYYVFEPTPDLCNGSIPDNLPVMVFLHGHRSNRYGPINKYSYPYCAYGVYPIDVSETWYFGFARNHDYRKGESFAPNDKVANYTEERVLRMIYDLARNPPGPSVDTQRIYLFGHSMGGTGSLAFAQRYPNVFAAIYSGQPVTLFSPTEGHAEPWPADVAAKWGPHELNLPVAISAPNHWGDHLQKYEGTGVYDWENLQAAFDPNDPLHRMVDEMAPFGIDHGTTDNAVLFLPQGQPLYPLLNASGQTWAGAITDEAHQWSFFGWPLPNLAKVQEVPFWGFQAIRDETIPGFRFLSGNNTQLPTRPTTYNQRILWSASWNAWDGEPIDLQDEWQMSFCAVNEGSQKCGGSSSIQVDITPRRLQHFQVIPGKEYRWEVYRISNDKLVESGFVTADEYGLLTVEQVEIFASGTRLRIYAP